MAAAKRCFEEGCPWRGHDREGLGSWRTVPRFGRSSFWEIRALYCRQGDLSHTVEVEIQQRGGREEEVRPRAHSLVHMHLSIENCHVSSAPLQLSRASIHPQSAAPLCQLTHAHTPACAPVTDS